MKWNRVISKSRFPMDGGGFIKGLKPEREQKHHMDIPVFQSFYWDSDLRSSNIDLWSSRSDLRYSGNERSRERLFQGTNSIENECSSIPAFYPSSIFRILPVKNSHFTRDFAPVRTTSEKNLVLSQLALYCCQRKNINSTQQLNRPRDLDGKT